MTAPQPLKRRVNLRIREMLNEWAGWQKDRCGLSFPSQVSFVQERVQTSGQGGSDHREMPEEVVKLDREIGKLAPGNRRLVALEYCDKRPQKCKAADLGMPRQVFSARLGWIQEQLSFAMWG